MMIRGLLCKHHSQQSFYLCESRKKFEARVASAFKSLTLGSLF